VLGKDVDKAVLNSALGSVLRTGSDYIKTGIKDLSSSLRTAYDDATNSGKNLESNIKRQEEIVTAYNSGVQDLETARAPLQSDYDKYLDAKDGYENYDARMAREGYQVYGDEYGSSYGKFVGGEWGPIDGGSEGSWMGWVGRQWVAAPTQGEFLANANTYAEKVNAALPAYEKLAEESKETLAGLSTELDGLKTALPALEKTFIDQKTALDTTVKAFQEQEEANAQFITNLVKDTTDAKLSIEQATGETLTDEQLDGFVQTGDVKSAAATYIDTNTTDRDEAEVALNTLGYTGTSGEIESFVGRTKDADLASNVEAYVDPRQMTADEFAGYAGEENFIYDPADTSFLDQYVGQRDEAATADLFRTYADPLATTDQEARDIYMQQYADLYGVDAEDVSDDTVGQFFADEGNTAESDYTGGVQNRLSQDLGFDDYADRTYAVESMGEDRPDAGMWEDFQTTSGVVGMEDTGLMPTQFVETDQAADLLPETPGAEEVAVATPDETNEQTADQAGAEPDFTQTLTGMMEQEQEQPTDYGPGVQVAAAPVGQSDVMSDVGPDPIQSIGLQSVSEQPISRTAGTGVASLLSAEPEQAEKPQSALSTTEGTSVYNALTGADTTGTIAQRVLESDPDAIQTGGVYSGAENEIAAGDTITQKYLGDTSEKQKALDDIGLTGTAGKNETTGPSQTDQALRTTAGDSPQESSLLTPEPLGRTTLPTGQSAKNIGELDMGDEYDEFAGVDEAVQQNAMEDIMERGYNGDAAPAAGDIASMLPSMQDEPDYSDGVAPFIDADGNTHYFTPDGGQVIYFADGRVQTMNSDGRNVFYLPDGSMVDYDDINNPNGRVRTFGADANGKPSATYGGTPTKKGGVNWDKVADKLLTPKMGALLAGAALGAASGPKGINPRGLRSIELGTGAQRVQTGAKGTGGKGGVRYFEKRAEGGAINGYAGGGGLGYLKGAHDGMADQINATIDNKRPAKLSGGEFVIPADVVSHLGNGNSDAGAKQLYALMERVRKARTGNDKQGKQINPKKYLPK